MPLAAALAVGWTAACARQGAPPGGPEDQRPPVVVATFPEPFGTLDDLRAFVRFDFDERISERVSGGTLEEAIQISPRVGELSVRKGRRSLEVRPTDGFRPGIVYRITLQPVVADLFGNQVSDPFELVFSTGVEPSPTTLAGEVWDRITGRAFPQASVQAVGADSLVHVASASREGIYAFRYLPGGTFRVWAFEDQDRDGQVDSAEVQGMAEATLALGDTLLLDVAVLTPDTLPAVLVSADALDSVTVVLELDDYLDPAAPLEGVEVELEREGAVAPAIERVLHEADYTAYVQAVVDSLARLDSIARVEAEAEAAALRAARVDSARAEADSVAEAALAVGDTAAAAAALLAADSAAARVALTDTAAAPAGAGGAPTPDTTAVRPGAGRGARPPGAPALPRGGPPGRGPARLDPLPGARPGPLEGTQRVLPGRRIVALLVAPLEVDVEYTARLSGAVNINGLGGGGGEATVVLAPAAVDTLTVEDTLAVTDTARVDTTWVSFGPAVETEGPDGIATGVAGFRAVGASAGRAGARAAREAELGTVALGSCRIMSSRSRDPDRVRAWGPRGTRPGPPGPGASACVPGGPEEVARPRSRPSTERRHR